MAYNDDHKQLAKAFLASCAGETSVSRRMLVAMAALAYKGDGLENVAGLSQVAIANTADGYDCLVVYHRASKRLVFVNRGAEGGSSIRDWIEGAQAAFGAYGGPLTEAVDLFEQTIEQLSADALPGVARDEVHEVMATGHSWGGALAEAQIALGPTILDKLGYEGLPFSGVGIASAGFAAAIEGLSAARKLPIAPETDWAMSHYIRRDDPIRIPGHRTLGQQFMMPGIWLPMSYLPQKGPPTEWMITAEAGINHDNGLYFDQFIVNAAGAYVSEADKHYYLKKGTLIRLEGDHPKKTRFGTQHPDKALKV